jgi:uncharacterized membrane protein YbjE (DUF340 family)
VWNILVPLVAGILIGLFFQNRKRVDAGRITFGVIIVLIFSMGYSIGSNSELLKSMPKIGSVGLAILTLSILFSLLFLRVLRRLVRLD